MHRSNQYKGIKSVIFKRSRRVFRLCLLFFILFFVFLGLVAYSLHSDVGYPHFSTDYNSDRVVKAELSDGLLYVPVLKASDSDVYAMYVKDDSSILILLSTENVDQTMREIISIALSSSSCAEVDISTTALKGRTQAIDAELKAALIKNPAAEPFVNNCGNVFLDTTVDVISPFCVPLMITTAVLLVLFSITGIYHITRVSKIYKSLIDIDDISDDMINRLDSQCTSLYNIAVNKHLIITTDFCIMLKKYDLVALSSIQWLYIEAKFRFSKPIHKKLIAYTKDCKRHVIISEKCKNSYCKADMVADIIKSRTEIPNEGYDKRILKKLKLMKKSINTDDPDIPTHTDSIDESL